MSQLFERCNGLVLEELFFLDTQLNPGGLLCLVFACASVVKINDLTSPLVSEIITTVLLLENQKRL